MFGITKYTAVVVLVAAAASVPIVPASAKILECVSSESGDCNYVGSATPDDPLMEEARRLMEALRPLAEGGHPNPNTTITKMSSSKVLLEDAKKIFGDKLIETETSTKEETKSEKDDRAYADRYVQGVFDIWEDEECMSGSLDVSSPDFKAADAIRVFDKCRLVHLRNFFPTEFLKDYKRNITSYVKGIASGRISEKGQTSYAGEPYYFGENAKHRFDLCFTDDLLSEEIMAGDLLLDILENESVLDDRVQMLDFGAILAEPGAPLQNWHRDGGDYLFTRSFRTSKIAGHDLPPFAVAVITPLLNVTMEHGPTEFCMGFSNLVGIDSERPGNVPVKDPKLRKKLNKMLAYDNSCPAKAWRAPILNFGDVLLFDYNMLHRGGPNNSTDLRGLIYNTYVRNWYKDPNWSQPQKAKHSKDGSDSLMGKFSKDMQRISRNVRLAIPDEIKPEDPDVLANTQFDDLEKLKQFRPSHFAEIYESEEQLEVFFRLSNIDVNIQGLQACFELDSMCFNFPPGKDLLVEAEVGEEITIRAPGKGVIKAFNVESFQKQVVISSLNTEF